jgi:hypothetical protein
MSEAKDARYFLSKAEQCFRLAASLETDRRAADLLRELGYEFVDQAVALGADPAVLPKSWRRPPP